MMNATIDEVYISTKIAYPVMHKEIIFHGSHFKGKKVSEHQYQKFELAYSMIAKLYDKAVKFVQGLEW